MAMCCNVLQCAAVSHDSFAFLGHDIHHHPFIITTLGAVSCCIVAPCLHTFALVDNRMHHLHHHHRCTCVAVCYSVLYCVAVCVHTFAFLGHHIHHHHHHHRIRRRSTRLLRHPQHTTWGCVLACLPPRWHCTRRHPGHPRHCTRRHPGHSAR